MKHALKTLPFVFLLSATLYADSARANFTLFSRLAPRSFEDDPLWHIKATRTDRAWKLLEAKNIVPGEGVLIAHPDSGFSPHPEIPVARDKSGGVLLKAGYDFVADQKGSRDVLHAGDGPLSTPGHGVQALSLMISPNDEGLEGFPKVVGTAPGAQVLPLKTSSGVFVTKPSALARAIDLAVAEEASVIAIAQGTPFVSEALWASIQRAKKAGIIIIAAGGNVVPFVVYPAAYPDVIAVAATTVNDSPSWVSSFGNHIDVALPGANIATAWVYRDPITKLITRSVRPCFGTTLATGQLAGIAAMWLSYHGKESLQKRYGERLPHVFKQLLTANVRVPDGWNSKRYGAGIVDAEALLLAPLPQ